MSDLRKTLGLPRARDLKSNKLEDIQNMFRLLFERLDKSYRDIRDSAESGLTTKNWDIRESTVADVTAGNSVAVGNLIVIHRTSGVRYEHEV